MNELKQFVIVADISKAYDNVNLEILDYFMSNNITDPVIKNQWKGELMDLKIIDINVNGEIIKRTKGIPQGSALAPLLFNFYITNIISYAASLFNSNDFDTYIYADNWIIQTKNSNLEEAENILININNILGIFGLNFELKDVIIHPINKIKDLPNDVKNYWTKDKIIETIKNFNKNEFTFRLLGWYFSIDKENNLSFNGSKLIFDFTKEKAKYFKRWKDVINYWQIYIISKFRYIYNGIIATELNNLAKAYKIWFIKESHTWLQKNLCCYTVSKEFINNIINGETNKPKSFFEYWRHMNIKEDIQYKKLQLIKLQKVGNFILDNKIYAGVYHITNTIKNDSFINNLGERFKNCDKATEKQYNRLINIFEATYMAIMRDLDWNTEIFEDIEIYNNKICRLKTYKYKNYII